MAKLILKVNYYKPGRSKSMGGYAKYIATRENVEKNEDKVLQLKSTESQQELIEKLLRDFPESIHSEEYQAYCSDGTRENASEYITRTLEDNIPQIIDSPTYADYIATRPRAERIGSHGLFSSGDEPIVLSKVSEELNEHQGNVWVFIASLKSIKNAIIKEAMNLNQESNQKQTAAHQKSRVSAVAVTRLFRNLCGIFQGKLDDENRQTIHQSAVDRRIRREDEAKRNAELTYD